jgi:hypothetical protein
VTVELLEPGRKPRAERRFRYVEGQTEILEMRMTQIATTVVDGATNRIALPPIEYRFEAVVTDVDEVGVATLDMVLIHVEAVEDEEGGAEMDAATLAQLNVALAPLAGLRVITQVDDRGITIAAATDLRDIDPALVAQLGDVLGSVNQVAAPLPEEPIGVGARWVSEGTASSNGLTFRTRQTSTLKAATDDSLRITLAGTQQGVPGPVDLPTLPEGYTATLDSLTGTLTGQMTVDLARLVPVSRAEGDLTIVLTAADGSTSQQVESRAQTTVEIAPGEE